MQKKYYTFCQIVLLVLPTEGFHVTAVGGFPLLKLFGSLRYCWGPPFFALSPILCHVVMPLCLYALTYQVCISFLWTIKMIPYFNVGLTYGIHWNWAFTESYL